jgi:hypothetical protein
MQKHALTKDNPAQKDDRLKLEHHVAKKDDNGDMLRQIWCVLTENRRCTAPKIAAKGNPPGRYQATCRPHARPNAAAWT